MAVARCDFPAARRSAEVGGVVLLRETLDQAVDAFLLHHGIELAAVGEDQADAFDRDVVHLPALAIVAHLKLDRQRLAAGADELRAHRRLVFSIALAAAR